MSLNFAAGYFGLEGRVGLWQSALESFLMHILPGTDFAGGGAVDMFHTFTDPEHRGKVSSSSSAFWSTTVLSMISICY